MSDLPHAAAGLPSPVLLSRGAETRRILVIAGPLAAAYLAEYAMVLTTKIVVGRLGYRELGGTGLAGDVASDVIVVIAGLLSVVGVLVSEAEGRGNRTAGGHATRQGLLLATLLGIPASVLVWQLDEVIALTGQDPEILAVMEPYLGPLALSVLPTLWFFVLRSFAAAVARTRAVMLITLAAIGLNYVLTLALVEGMFGLPGLGVAGAGWARTVVAVAMLAALVVHMHRTPAFRGYGLFQGRFRPDPARLREILRIGAPVACIVILESSLFLAVSILSGVLGPVPLATYQVMIAWVGIAFVMAQGLAEAGMVRVAHGAGRGSLAASRQSGLVTFGIGVAWLALLAIVPLSFPETLVRAFLDPADEGFGEVLALTSRLVVLAAFFQVFDGLQVMASFALRGLRDTLVPLWLGAIGYLVLGVGGGALLAFPLGLGADGLWWGLAIGLTVSGSLLAGRFVLLTRPAPAPPRP